MEVGYRTETITLHVSRLECVLQEPDGNAETTMYVRNKNRSRALMDFWSRCVLRLGDIEKPTVEHLMKLLEPDYLQIGLNVYCLATGKCTLRLAGACARCGKPNGAEIDLTPWMEPEIPGDIVGPDPTWEFYLPKTGKHLVYGYVTAEKEFAAMEHEQTDLNYYDWIAIRSVDGSDRVKQREVASWPMSDHIAFREEFKKRKEWYETRIGLRHTCGFWEEVNLMQDPRFVMPGVIA